MQNLNYSALYYFKLVVEHGSIAKASNALDIGPSAISMQIKALEKYFKKDLFSRKKRSLVLTRDGKIVYDYAIEVFRISAELLSVVREEKAAKSVKVQLGVQSGVPKNLIAKLTSHIYSKNAAHVTIINSDLESLTAEIINHGLDVAILNYPPIVRDKSIVSTKCILKSPIVLAGAAKFLPLKGKGLNQFSNAPLILPASHLDLRRKLEIEFARNNLQLNIVGEVDDTIVKKNMAIAGNGIIPIMKAAIADYVKNEKLFILNESLRLEDEIWLMSAKTKTTNPVVESLFKDFAY